MHSCGILIEDQGSRLCSFLWSGAAHYHCIALCSVGQAPFVCSFVCLFIYLSCILIGNFAIYPRLAPDSLFPCICLTNDRIIGVYHYIFLSKGHISLKNALRQIIPICSYNKFTPETVPFLYWLWLGLKMSPVLHFSSASFLCTLYRVLPFLKAQSSEKWISTPHLLTVI